MSVGSSDTSVLFLILVICVFSHCSVVSLAKVCQFYWSLQRTSFLFYWFSLLFYCFLLHWFLLVYLLFPAFCLLWFYFDFPFYWGESLDYWFWYFFLFPNISFQCYTFSSQHCLSYVLNVLTFWTFIFIQFHVFFKFFFYISSLMYGLCRNVFEDFLCYWLLFLFHCTSR